MQYSYFTPTLSGPNPNGSATVEALADVPTEATVIYAVVDGIRVAQVALDGRIIHPMDDRSYEAGNIRSY